ncbi:MAG TPA: hypothetical protein VGB99_09985 [Acidobacteriota bacterium]|jgi:hypothetical protein
MLQGFNTEIEVEGRRFHVQTEDKGRQHPVIETLVYCGGAIVASRKTPYAAELEDVELLELMRRQHRSLLQATRGGQYQQQAQASEAERYRSVRGAELDRVVEEFLKRLA